MAKWKLVRTEHVQISKNFIVNEAGPENIGWSWRRNSYEKEERNCHQGWDKPWRLDWQLPWKWSKARVDTWCAGRETDQANFDFPEASASRWNPSSAGMHSWVTPSIYRKGKRNLRTVNENWVYTFKKLAIFSALYRKLIKTSGFPKVTFNHAALKGISRTACTDVESVPRYIYVEVNLQNCF